MPLASLYEHRFRRLCIFINGLSSRGSLLPFSTAFSTKRSVHDLNLLSSWCSGISTSLSIPLWLSSVFPPLTADIFLHLHVHFLRDSLHHQLQIFSVKPQRLGHSPAVTQKRASDLVVAVCNRCWGGSPTGPEGGPHAVAEVAGEELRRGVACSQGQPDGHALLVMRSADSSCFHFKMHCETSKMNMYI